MWELYIIFSSYYLICICKMYLISHVSEMNIHLLSYLPTLCLENWKSINSFSCSLWAWHITIFTDSAGPLYQSKFTPKCSRHLITLWADDIVGVLYESDKWFILHYDDFNDGYMSCYECLRFTRSVYYLYIFTALRLMVHCIFSNVRIS